MSTDQEPVVFGTAMESLARALRDRITPQLKEELKGKGVDLDRLQTAYSLTTWSEFMGLLGTRLLGDVPESERYHQLGRIFMRGFVETPLGMAALALAKLVGPRRALERMGRNFKQATNYLEAEFTAVSPNEVTLRTYTGPSFLAHAADRSTRVAEYRHGLLTEMVVLVGAKNSKVEIVDHHPERQDVTFRITWS